MSRVKGGGRYLLERMFNLLITFLPSHRLRQGWLRMLGAHIGRDSTVMMGTTMFAPKQLYSMGSPSPTERGSPALTGTGWSVPPAEPMALADAIHEALNHPALASNYADAARTLGPDDLLHDRYVVLRKGRRDALGKRCVQVLEHRIQFGNRDVRRSAGQ